MTTFRTTLLRLANEQDAAERLRLSGLLASELEVAFNRQGNQNQLALSDTEDVLLKKIDHLQKDVGDNNTLISTFLSTFPAQLATFQTEMRAAVAEETARGLGKLSEEIEGLYQGQARISGEVGDLAERIVSVEKTLEARPEQRAAEHAAIVEEIGGRTFEKLEEFGHELTEFKIAFAVFNASMLLSEHAVIVIDLAQIITSVNQKACSYFGYTAEELIGQPLDVLIPERFREAHRKHIEAFALSLDSQRLMADRHEVYGLRKDGTEFPIRAAIVKVSNGFTAVVERVGDAG